MNSPTRRTCRHCRQRFFPDYRNAYHQRFCCKPECQRDSKRVSQRRWLRKPKNRNYFREPDNAARVQDWRLAHPGYWRPHWHRCASATTTAPTPTPASEATRPLPPRTLQDVCRSKLPVLTGIVARLGCCTLQEDTAQCALELVKEAQCILHQCQSSLSLPRPAVLAVNYYETG
jgi:hypothetical protein